MLYKKHAEKVGNISIKVLEEFGRITELWLHVLKDIYRGKTDLKLTLEQMVKIGIESLPLALTTSAFVGMVFAVQIAGEF
ncbi:MAG: ABC transporter permease, partial [Candidatus Margulisbacteria bacterium]|nr:ABC transporter permease [Candidatus Margulisiibacteriota bacterium]